MLGLLFTFFVAFSGRRLRCLLYWFRLVVCADVPLLVALVSRVAKMADTRFVLQNSLDVHDFA